MTRIDINSFNNYGYTILKSFFSNDEIDSLNMTISDQLKNRCLINSKMTVDILTGELAGKRLLLKDTSDTLLQENYKLNDLHLESEICRNICLDTKLCDQLKLLLNDNPVAINSLAFNKGSQQPYHFDTY